MSEDVATRSKRLHSYGSRSLDERSDGGLDFPRTTCSSCHSRLRDSSPVVVLGGREGLGPRSLKVGRGRVGLSSRAMRDRGGLGRLDNAVRVRGTGSGLVSRGTGHLPPGLKGERALETWGIGGGSGLSCCVERTLRGTRAGGDEEREDEDEAALDFTLDRARVRVDVGDVARVLAGAGREDASRDGRAESSADVAVFADGRLVRRLARPALGL
ncbi:hypothetical protein BD626DRAFT_209191 [Schizophyllum amplum]|uniref:Cytochrome c domain-containing protein n=1 Tax=Schizophyllum amplum TaxID=97359 RepID=A0A550BYF2_9AGAR|nr:hypothetical protein BD626DRAFT_209191 [Auriculariopsis ampla]